MSGANPRGGMFEVFNTMLEEDASLFCFSSTSGNYDTRLMGTNAGNTLFFTGKFGNLLLDLWGFIFRKWAIYVVL